MNLAYNVAQVMHKIRVKLYPNYLPGYENTFIARTDSEASLTIEQVCAALRDSPDPKTNPLSFRFRTNKPLRKLAESIAIEIDGFAEVDAYIDEFVDTEDNTRNNWYHPGNLFSVSGNKIKIEGDDPGTGLFFVPTNGSPAVKVTRFNENSHSSIRGITPNCDFDNCRVEIRTQYSGSMGKPLKKVRIISSNFTLDRA